MPPFQHIDTGTIFPFPSPSKVVCTFLLFLLMVMVTLFVQGKSLSEYYKMIQDQLIIRPNFTN